uniref:Leukocyte antigen CD37 n=1 Tax=Macaca fascicularis TaxID=9541 RepID=A0A7N9CZJ5_MACFA
MSAQESCLSLIKYFLFVFNLFFFVLGSLIFCFGIWILIDKTSFVSFVGLAFVPLQIWSKVLAISGVFTMGLALLGCVGALKELRCLLGLYFGMLLLLFATQITLGILISTQRAQLERSLQDIVEKTIQKYHTNPEETAAEESWDYVQFQVSPLLQLPPRLTRLSPVLRGDSTPTWPRPPALHDLTHSQPLPGPTPATPQMTQLAPAWPSLPVPRPWHGFAIYLGRLRPRPDPAPTGGSQAPSPKTLARHGFLPRSESGFHRTPPRMRLTGSRTPIHLSGIRGSIAPPTNLWFRARRCSYFPSPRSPRDPSLPAPFPVMSPGPGPIATPAHWPPLHTHHLVPCFPT